MSSKETQSECQRCGNCCMKGGPALHSVDLNKISQGMIKREHLVTIRRGEPVFFPDERSPVSAGKEIIKLKGKPGKWLCGFYDQENSICSIYTYRPHECILLKCWDTTELKRIAGRDLLSRFDIIPPEELILEYIHRHEEGCRLVIFERFDFNKRMSFTKKDVADLTEIVNIDLALRSEAIHRFNLSLDLELFYFGRPLFKILTQFGLGAREENNRVVLVHS